MRTTFNFDDALVSQLMAATGATSKTAAIEIAMRDYLERKAAKDLAKLYGKAPDFELPARRRSKKK